jgi:hypothetical protein
MEFHKMVTWGLFHPFVAQMSLDRYERVSVVFIWLNGFGSTGMRWPWKEGSML